MSKPLKEKVSITLDGDLIESIKKLAEKDDRAFSSYINRTLRRYVEYQAEVDAAIEKAANR